MTHFIEKSELNHCKFSVKSKLKPIKYLLFLLVYSPFNPVFAQITWTENVAPIVYSNCGSCHSPGGVAPFALIDYQDVKQFYYSMMGSIEKKRMPPFPADLSKRRYAHEKVLSSQEINALKQWAEDGFIEGDISKLPPAPKPPKSSELDRVDAHYQIPKNLVYTIKDEYRCFAIPTNTSVDKMLKSIEVVPGNRRIVHHALIFQDTSSLPYKLDQATKEPGYLSAGGTGSPSSELIAMYVPGQDPYRYPLNFAARLKKNSYIVIQIHYSPGVVNEIDSTAVNFEWENVQGQREVFVASPLNFSQQSLINYPLYIQANTIATFYNQFPINNKLSILSVAPHMHLLGKSIEAVNVFNGDTTPIINIPKWDFHWQMAYTFRNPIVLQKGSKLLGKAVYDNTGSNPYNPNYPHPKDVSAGEGTADEMFLVYFWYTLYKTGDELLSLDTSKLKILSDQPLKDLHFELYPNPSSDVVKLHSNSKIFEIEISEMSGQLINKFPVNSKTVEIDIIDFKPGTYTFRIANQFGWQSIKVIKQP